MSLRLSEFPTHQRMSGAASPSSTRSHQRLIRCSGTMFEVVALILVAICASAPYLNSLDGKFAYDDKVRDFPAS